MTRCRDVIVSLRVLTAFMVACCHCNQNIATLRHGPGADSDFAEEATAVTLGHSTDQPTVFSDFSARVRAVIGSCLAAITCVEKSQRRPRAEGEGCGGLASVCLGPGSSRGPASRQELECRVEEILCENTDPGADTCRDTYHRCSTGAPGALSSATRGTTSQ